MSQADVDCGTINCTGLFWANLVTLGAYGSFSTSYQLCC